jgi:hypothetical protein
LKQHPHRYSLRYLSANLLMLPWKIKIAKWVKVFFFCQLAKHSVGLITFNRLMWIQSLRNSGGIFIYTY